MGNLGSQPSHGQTFGKHQNMTYWVKTVGPWTLTLGCLHIYDTLSAAFRVPLESRQGLGRRLVVHDATRWIFSIPQLAHGSLRQNPTCATTRGSVSEALLEKPSVRGVPWKPRSPPFEKPAYPKSCRNCLLMAPARRGRISTVLPVTLVK